MISFKQFLNEDFERLDLDKLKEDCAFFLNLIKGRIKCISEFREIL